MGKVLTGELLLIVHGEVMDRKGYYGSDLLRLLV